MSWISFEIILTYTNCTIMGVQPVKIWGALMSWSKELTNKYLGVVLANRLNWASNISYLKIIIIVNWELYFLV